VAIVDAIHVRHVEHLIRQELGSLANLQIVNQKVGKKLGVTLREASAVIIHGSTKMTAEVIAEMRVCKAIVTASIGYDHVDLEAARVKGISVSNVPGYCVEEVADHAIGLLIPITRKIVFLNNAAKTGKWNARETVERIPRLRGRTLGIIGLGRIGMAVALRAHALGLRVIAYDPYITPGKDRSIGVTLVDFEDILHESDIISLHVPLTKETWHMLGRNEFAKMKHGIFIINTARGAIVDSSALCEALKSGKVAGAALDVLEREPPDYEDPILQMDQVIVTPHTAFFSTESEEDRERMAAQEIARVLQNARPMNLVSQNAYGVSDDPYNA
jgi:D-3-phosphoglycerate dehydrogenase